MLDVWSILLLEFHNGETAANLIGSLHCFIKYSLTLFITSKKQYCSAGICPFQNNAVLCDSFTAMLASGSTRFIFPTVILDPWY